MKNLLFLFLVFITTISSYAQTPGKLIYKSDFSRPLDCKDWVAEIDNLPGHTSTVYTYSNALVLDTWGGVTVWLNKKLTGNIQIEYDRIVQMGKGCNDRIGDLNQFWMATDPKNASLFTRSGKFQEYDNLNLYYAGVGGNFNTTSRFRKYLTPTSKPVVKEYTDKEHLLEANKVYRIKIIVKNGTSSFWLNGECWFNYTDPSPLTSGYFGFRSLQSRQEIKNLRIYALD
ncbi:DUF6250 domain-containing protein [Pedobacter heparinus]|uniref:DUF6250 domain-containing protein n=1 Tax=Pedobacter heparinus (strain ATCC 13125 / DSM 2366 / CIP 104194 / JCM 7457 / NBRC 12017 / NCIMB 9290 / NRRL B-14731 / HIM 762-3) TaxID=485917 RepID=C6Y1P4_PEDHD|nr:DUF6250 domain-containing protein [Pedobacter heparinus]ACU05036.1 hypothetical protein Phep_2837 [Pedobacter heparinus DSM 2366]